METERNQESTTDQRRIQAMLRRHQDPDFLNLDGLRTVAVEDNGDHYMVTVAGELRPSACPQCGHPVLYRHGTQAQSFIDTPMHGKRVCVRIDRMRFRCKACGRTLFEPLPAVDDKRQSTRRLIRHIEAHSLRKTFAELSREVGVDDKTIRNIFDDYAARLGASVHFETPEVLGIDELKIIGQYRAMLTNVGRLTLFDMLPTRKKVDLISYFRRLPDKKRVKILTTDLWNVYRQVARDQFPGTPIVADRFHVVRMANNALERVRKSIRKGLPTRERLMLKDDRFVLLSRRQNLSEGVLGKLQAWTERFPRLLAAYDAKEAFHDIYSHACKDDAQRAAQAWERALDPQVASAFREVSVALRSWWEEIFNYFDQPVTNAYAESINNLAKGLNRMGRGYSFDVIRARLLYDSGARKDGRATIRKKVRRRSATGPATACLAGLESDLETKSWFTERTIEYGPHISTLVRKLEAGEFD